MKGLVAKVALEGATMGFDKLYSYAIPPELHKAAVSGKRVTVPFGKGNTTRRGMVFEVLEEELKGLKYKARKSLPESSDCDENDLSMS